MHIHELQYLQTIAQYKSISAASDKLHLSQQRLSRIVQNIEKEFELTIFTRSKKGVVLTKEGVQFIKYAQQMLNIYSSMQNIKNHISPAAHLVCGIDKHINQHLLHQLLLVFSQYPAITFSFEQMSSSFEIIDALVSQKIHLALSASVDQTVQNYFYAKISAEQTIKRYPLSTERMYCIMHKDNPSSAKEALTITEAVNYPMTFCIADSTYSNLIQNPLNMPINIFLETDSLEIQLECINNNLAVGLMDGFTLPYITKHYPNIRAVPLLDSVDIVLSFYFNTDYDFLEAESLKNDILHLFCK